MKNHAPDDHQYDDIMNLPHHQSQRRPHMPLSDRAAQFSPFAALTGHDAAIKETARLTDKRVELDEGEKAYLNDRLLIVDEHLDEGPEISITYFLPDGRKAGGAYVIETGIVKKIDEYEHSVVMQNSIIIPIDDIVAIDGALFNYADE